MDKDARAFLTCGPMTFLGRLTEREELCSMPAKIWKDGMRRFVIRCRLYGGLFFEQLRETSLLASEASKGLMP